MSTLGFITLFKKEVHRFMKVWLQTILAPMMTAVLYVMVFGHVFSGRVEVFNSINYIHFLVPGLVIMAALQNAFANSSSSIIQSKVSGNIFFVLITPLSSLEIYLAFVMAAIVRGMLVGLGVYIISLIFVAPILYSIYWVMGFITLGCAILASVGIIAGIWAEKFDQLAGVQNFIILPLTFLSGAFYSVESLPEYWQGLSYLNPLFYMIDGFRYGFLGQSDSNPWTSMLIVGALLISLASFTIYLLKSGYKLRN